MAPLFSLPASPGSHHVLTGPLHPALRYRQRGRASLSTQSKMSSLRLIKKTVSLESSYSVSAMHKISLLKSFV